MTQEKVFLVNKCFHNTNNCINSLTTYFSKSSRNLQKIKELLMTGPLNLYQSIKDLYVKDMNKINKITLGMKSHCSWDFIIQDMDKKGFINIIQYQELRFRQNMKNKLCFCLQPHFL